MNNPDAPVILHAPWALDGAGGATADAAVLVAANGTVRAYGPAAEVIPAHAGVKVRAMRAVLMPALVNARVQLSHAALRGKIPGGAGFVPWAERVTAGMRGVDSEEFEAAVTVAADELERSGVAVVGDVGTWAGAGEVIVPALARRGLRGGFFADDPLDTLAGGTDFYPGFRRGISSRGVTLHDEATLASMAAWARDHAALLTLPLHDHAPARTLSHDGRTALGPHTLAAGLSDARRDELVRIADSGTRVVLCPREDLYVQTLLPPLPDVLAAGLRPAVGSGSPAGNTTLDVLAEVASLHARFPGISPAKLVAMATGWGADALGLAGLGRIAVGNAPGILAVALPERAAGIDPHAQVIKSTPASRTRVYPVG